MRDTITRALTLTLPALALCLGLAPDAAAQRRGGGGGNPPPASKATIVLVGGKEMEDVDIQEEKFKKIRFRARGRGVEEIDGERVEEIRYLDPHPSFSTGRSQQLAGLYEKAATSFTSARNAAEEGSWLWFHSTYWLGEALLGLGKGKEAADEFQRLLKKDGEHFLAPAAIFGLGQAQAEDKKYSEAAATFKKLDDGFGAYWAARCQLGIGDAALASGNIAEARRGYKFAEDRASRYPDLRRAARVGTGKTFIADKRWTDAVGFFDAIASEPGVAPDVAGGAWVGKGDCRMAQAKEKNASDPDKNLLKEALIAYQTCVVRYAGTPAYPKALFMSAELYGQLGLEKLAERMREELRSRCPNSPWTEKLGK